MSQPQHTPASFSEQGAKAAQAKVDMCVNQLKAIFSAWPASLKTDVEVVNYKREFLNAMAQFKIVSEVQIKAGMAEARRKAEAGERYLPSGATFAGWCRGSAKDLNLADLDTAHRLVNKRAWEQLHPAFQCIAAETYTMDEVMTPEYRDLATGRHVPAKVNKNAVKNRWQFGLWVQSQDNKYARANFKTFYDEVVDRVRSGEKFERIEAIESQEGHRGNPTGCIHTKQRPDEARAQFSSMLSSLQRENRGVA